MRKITILLADNDQVSLNNLEKFFRKNGFLTITASNILETKEALHNNKALKLAVLDIRLKEDADDRDISGLVLAKTMSPELPKIIYTKFPAYKYVRDAFVIDTKGYPAAIDFVAKQEGLQLLLYAVLDALFLRSLLKGDDKAWKRLWDEEAWRLIAIGRHYGLSDEDAEKTCLETFEDLAKDAALGRKQPVLKRNQLRTLLAEKVLQKVENFEHREQRQRSSTHPKAAAENKGSFIDQRLLADIAGPAIGKKISREVLVEQLSKAVRGLTPRQQKVITLRLFQQTSPPDIAKKLGIKEKTVRKHLDIAINHLRIKVAELGEE